MEKVLVASIEDQTSHISLSQNLIESKILMLLNSVKAERDREDASLSHIILFELLHIVHN